VIVEFIGSTGAGKTTLISEVQHRLAETSAVTTSFDALATPLGLSHIAHPTARNLFQEIIGFPFFLGSLNRHKEFVAFALKMLARQATFSLFTVNNLRSLERKIGVYEVISRKRPDQTILVDEGTLLLAHNIFVYSNVDYTHDEIARFASLVPLPDIIIYIKAPIDILVQRSLRRSDPPRELKSRDQGVIERNVRRAVDMFDKLIQAEHIQSRLLIVQNSGSNGREYDTAADNIVKFILNYELANK